MPTVSIDHVDLTFYRMPWVKTGKRVPKGTNAKRKAEFVAKPSSSKKSKGYGSKGIDWDAAMKLATTAANKAINKNIETQNSCAVIRMVADDKVTASEGYLLHGLNWKPANPASPTVRVMNLSSAMIFNLGYLSQVGQSNLPGYRQGQRINAKSLSFTVVASLPQLSSDATYHWRVVRRKNDATGNKAYAIPTIVPMEVVGLFKPASDGPLASSIQYPTDDQSVNTPFPSYVSAMRQNTDQWSFVSGAHGSYTVSASPLDPGDSDQKRTASFCQKMYVPLDQEWDFVSPNGMDIKGGNYFFVLWREGEQDYAMSAVAGSSAPGVVEKIQVYMDLAFKDG